MLHYPHPGQKHKQHSPLSPSNPSPCFPSLFHSHSHSPLPVPWRLCVIALSSDVFSVLRRMCVDWLSHKLALACLLVVERHNCAQRRRADRFIVLTVLATWPVSILLYIFSISFLHGLIEKEKAQQRGFYLNTNISLQTCTSCSCTDWTLSGHRKFSCTSWEMSAVWCRASERYWRITHPLGKQSSS